VDSYKLQAEPRRIGKAKYLGQIAHFSDQDPDGSNLLRIGVVNPKTNYIIGFLSGIE